MLNNELLERAGTALPCDPPQRNRWPYQVRRLRWLTHSGASGVAIWNRYDRVPMLNCELEDELVGTALPCGPPQRNRWPDSVATPQTVNTLRRVRRGTSGTGTTAFPCSTV